MVRPGRRTYYTRATRSSGGSKSGSSGSGGGSSNSPNDAVKAEADRRAAESAAKAAASGSGGGWDSDEAVRNYSQYLRSKYGVSDSALNEANIRAKLEEAHRSGVYRSSSEVESSGSSSRIMAAEREAFNREVQSVTEIRSGGREASREELSRYRDSLDPEYVRRRERELRKKDLEREYSRRGFSYKGSRYSGEAAAEKVIQLEESGFGAEVSRRREISEDLERFGGVDSEGRRLVMGYSYRGEDYFGAEGADVLARLEKGGEVSISRFGSGMEVYSGDKMPVIYGRPSTASALRLREIAIAEEKRRAWERELVGADVWPNVKRGESVKSVDPVDLRVEGFAVAGGALLSEGERRLRSLGLEVVDVSPSVVKKGSDKVYAYKFDWPTEFESRGSAAGVVGRVSRLPMAAALGLMGVSSGEIREYVDKPVTLADAPILGPLAMARYNEIRQIEKEAAIRKAESRSAAEFEDAELWRLGEIRRSGDKIVDVRAEPEGRYRGVENVGFYEKATAGAARVLGLGFVSSDLAKEIGARVNRLDALPGYDVELGHLGRVGLTGLALSGAAIAGAGGLGGLSVGGRALPVAGSMGASAQSAGATLAGWAAIGPVSAAGEKLSGSKLIGLGLGIYAGGKVTQALSNWRPIQSAQSEGLVFVKRGSARAARSVKDLTENKFLMGEGRAAGDYVSASNRWTGLQFRGRPVVGLAGGRVTVGARSARLSVSSLERGIGGDKLFGELAPRSAVERSFVLSASRRALAQGKFIGSEYSRLGAGLQVMDILKGQKSAFKDPSFTLRDVERVKRAAPELEDLIRNTQGVTVYGSKAAKQQMFKSAGVARDPADLDLFFKTQKGLEKFKAQAFEILGRKYGRSNVEISGNLINTRVGGRMDHALDLHYAGEPDMSLGLGSGRVSENFIHWGYRGQKETTIAGVKFMPLGEQVVRKGGSSVYIRTQGGKFFVDPRAYRVKDIGDFIEGSKTAIQSGRSGLSALNPIKRVNMLRAEEALNAFVKSRAKGAELFAGQGSEAVGWFFESPGAASLRASSFVGAGAVVGSGSPRVLSRPSPPNARAPFSGSRGPASVSAGGSLLSSIISSGGRSQPKSKAPSSVARSASPSASASRIPSSVGSVFRSGTPAASRVSGSRSPPSSPPSLLSPPQSAPSSRSPPSKAAPSVLGSSSASKSSGRSPGGYSVGRLSVVSSPMFIRSPGIRRPRELRIPRVPGGRPRKIKKLGPPRYRKQAGRILPGLTPESILGGESLLDYKDQLVAPVLKAGGKKRAKVKRRRRKK